MSSYGFIDSSSLLKNSFKQDTSTTDKIEDLDDDINGLKIQVKKKEGNRFMIKIRKIKCRAIEPKPEIEFSIQETGFSFSSVCSSAFPRGNSRTSEQLGQRPFPPNCSLVIVKSVPQ